MAQGWQYAVCRICLKTSRVSPKLVVAGRMKLEDVTEKGHSSEALEFAMHRPVRPTLAEFTAFLKGPKAVASIALVGIFVLLTLAFLYYAKPLSSQ